MSPRSAGVSGSAPMAAAMAWPEGRLREGEHHRGDRGVDLLVVLHLPVAEVEEGLPADIAARRREAAEQIVAVIADRRAEVGLGGVEDQAEERVGGRAA